MNRQHPSLFEQLVALTLMTAAAVVVIGVLWIAFTALLLAQDVMR